jgi:outer membrane protein TolC
MDIPIFSGFNRRSVLEQARIGLEQAQLDQQQTTQGILLEIESARIAYLNAGNDLIAQEENSKLAEKIYNTTLIKYREGVGSSLELSNAESTLYQTQGSYIGALFNLLTAKTNLTKALGYY